MYLALYILIKGQNKMQEKEKEKYKIAKGKKREGI